MQFISSPAIPQIKEDLIRRIDLKLSKDKDYLNLHYIIFQPDAVKDSLIFRLWSESKQKEIEIRSGEQYNYRLVFLKEGIGIDSLYLLSLDEIKLNSASGDKLFDAVNAVKDDTVRILNFNDIYFLRNNYSSIYNYLTNLVLKSGIENGEDSYSSTLGINPDDQMNSGLGVSSRNNRDYLIFEYVNGKHWDPKAGEAKTDRRKKTDDTPDFRWDLSFSSMSFSHKLMDFSVGSSALELTTEDKVLNVVPWQTQSLSLGFRSLIALARDKSDIYNATYIDARIFGRFNLNLGKNSDNLFFVSTDKNVLNTGNSFIADISITRPFTLPFLNIYVASGKRDFASPALTVNSGKNAYFSFTQFESTMSFYWNTSDKLTGRLRMDLGVGYYDIWEAVYDSGSELVTTEMKYNKFRPVVSLFYSFAPEDNPLFGFNLRLFDSVFKVKAWMKVLGFSENHTIRFETILVSSPVFRSEHEWESGSGTLFQLRYRYGL